MPNPRPLDVLKMVALGVLGRNFNFLYPEEKIKRLNSFRYGVGLMRDDSSPFPRVLLLLLLFNGIEFAAQKYEITEIMSEFMISAASLPLSLLFRILSVDLSNLDLNYLVMKTPGLSLISIIHPDHITQVLHWHAFVQQGYLTRGASMV